ncbi:MAG TPA: LLM class flavin-dependent oxidoreductase [Streptosporangiaceae bacterium]
MADYRHDLEFGSFITPSARTPERVVELARQSERSGLDLVTVQDHPYLPEFLDTWTLLSYIAAVTTRIRLVPNVLNLPLRPPVVLARSVASLDLLTGGRVELGLGAGGFWDAIEAAGGRRLAPAAAVDALGEAITIIRQVWAADQRGGVRVQGEHYRVAGLKRGPAPAHELGIWVGAYKPRMLALIGRAADGWLPSLSYLPKGVASLPDMNARIDDAAAAAGREPRAVRRLLNISGEFAATGSGLLHGPASQWAEELAGLALDLGISGFILATDDPAAIERFGQEVAPAVTALVAAERAEPGGHKPAGQAGAPGVPGAWPSGVSRDRLAGAGERPVAPAAPAGQVPSARGRAAGQHLAEIHDHLRQELDVIRDLVRQVSQGSLAAGSARAALNEMTMRQNNWTLGAYCAAYCGLVTQHHGLEDQAVFPYLRRSDPGLAPVIDRLEAEHVIIHQVIEDVDRALVRLVREPDGLGELAEAVDVLTDTLLSHLAYEEEQITGTLERFGFYQGQI